MLQKAGASSQVWEQRGRRKKKMIIIFWEMTIIIVTAVETSNLTRKKNFGYCYKKVN
jgi:hypothetical protein